MLKLFTTARKWGVALAGVLAQVVAANVLPDRWQHWAASLLALLTALFVYGVENAPAVPRQRQPV